MRPEPSETQEPKLQTARGGEREISEDEKLEFPNLIKTAHPLSNTVTRQPVGGGDDAFSFMLEKKEMYRSRGRNHTNNLKKKTN